jgi:hypothetical protein
LVVGIVVGNCICLACVWATKKIRTTSCSRGQAAPCCQLNDSLFQLATELSQMAQWDKTITDSSIFLFSIVYIPAAENKSYHSDKIQKQYAGQAFVHITQYGEQGAVHLRRVGVALVFKVEIPPGTVVYIPERSLAIFRVIHSFQGSNTSISGTTVVVFHGCLSLSLRLKISRWLNQTRVVQLRQPLVGKIGEAHRWRQLGSLSFHVSKALHSGLHTSNQGNIQW